jgi:outer membrane protein assembly factor BamB
MRRWVQVGGGLLAVALLLTDRPALAVITRLTPLSEILSQEQLIFLARVQKIDNDKPAMVLAIQQSFKGKPSFEKMPVVFKGDKVGQSKNHVAQLQKRLASDLPILIFASLNGRPKPIAFGYTNGTWFQMIGHKDAAQAGTFVWEFTHCEPYLRRTFNGTTAELAEIVQDGLMGKREPPKPNPKEEPGLGPEINKAAPVSEKTGRVPGSGSSYQNGPLLAVIPTFVVVGPLALLVALFPALFGGMILVFRRWMVLFSVASLESTVYLVHGWLQKYVKDSWWGSAAGLWYTLAAISLAGAWWSAWRYYQVPAEDKPEALRPRSSERMLLGLSSLLGLALAGYWSWRGLGLVTPWKELLAMVAVTWIGASYSVCLQRVIGQSPPRVLPTEGAMLWSLVVACLILGTTAPAGSSTDGFVVTATGAGSGEERLAKPYAPTVAWVYEAKDAGSFISSPLVVDNRLYVAAAHQAGLSSRFGRVYCLDRTSGKPLWQFPKSDQEEIQPVSLSSPCLADGRLYIGEGFHEDSECRLHCLRADTGEELWHFQSKSLPEPKRSHIESSPVVVDGKVYFGAGDDGIYSLDARTGQEQWNYPNVHVDTSPALVGDHLFAGTGYGEPYEVLCLAAATGKRQWRTQVSLPVWGSPTVKDGEVLVGLGNGNFVTSDDRPRGALLALAVDTGEIIWHYDVPDAVLTRPAVDHDHIYFGSRDQYCYCLDRQGQLVWKKALGSPLVAAPCLVGDHLLTAASGGQFFCLTTATGDIQWCFDAAKHSGKKPQLFSSPTAADGRVYFGAGLDNLVSSAAVVYCLDCWRRP